MIRIVYGMNFYSTIAIARMWKVSLFFIAPPLFFFFYQIYYTDAQKKDLNFPVNVSIFFGLNSLLFSKCSEVQQPPHLF